jgi:hypothetical protein
VLRAIDDGLSVMGEEPKKALYQYLVTIHSLKREDIPWRIDEFVSGLKKALGAASKVIEKLILKKLNEKIGTTFQESKGWEFSDYVEEARRKFEMLEHLAGAGDSAEYERSKEPQFSG